MTIAGGARWRDVWEEVGHLSSQLFSIVLQGRGVRTIALWDRMPNQPGLT